METLTTNGSTKEVATAIEKRNGRTAPALYEVHHDVPAMQEYGKLNQTLNQEPPKAWLKTHQSRSYLPIGRIEMMLRQVFGTFEVTIKSVGQIANSVYVVVTIKVPHPLKPGEFITQDGCGANPLQTDKDAGAIEWDKIKNNAVQLALPAAESYAIKDAAEKLGNLFGANLTRSDEMAFQSVYGEPVTHEDLQALFELKCEGLTASELENAERILREKETVSYVKLHNLLKSK